MALQQSKSSASVHGVCMGWWGGGCALRHLELVPSIYTLSIYLSIYLSTPQNCAFIFFQLVGFIISSYFFSNVVILAFFLLLRASFV